MWKSAIRLARRNTSSCPKRKSRPTPTSSPKRDSRVALAGHREAIVRDAQGRVERHFVILCFAARWLSGEPVLNEELDDARWLAPAALSSLRTTEGLAEIVAAAIERLDRPA